MRVGASGRVLASVRVRPCQARFSVAGAVCLPRVNPAARSRTACPCPFLRQRSAPRDDVSLRFRVLSPEQVQRLSNSEKIREAVRRSVAFLPMQMRAAVEALLVPETLAVISGTLALWAGSHAFGVGEIVDIILLGAGFLALGFGVFEGAGALYEFAVTAIGAQIESDLDRAAARFAHAATVLGVSLVQAVLLHGQGRAVIARGAPRIYPRPNVGPVPPSGNQLRLTRPSVLPGGTLGTTDPFGAVSIARNQALSEQRLTLFHELVHRYFSPRTGPLRRLRAELSLSAYARSALLRYVEEALAEGFAQLRCNGLVEAFGAFRFPLNGGYMTVSQLRAEGQAIGTIVVSGLALRVWVALGPVPKSP